ncbi:regulatory protein RecX [Leucobacter luti]|uniref:regulatory protein RecX n=1 Tax=Leucobacter luti TaxID=340320 RepID=UPI003D09007A
MAVRFLPAPGERESSPGADREDLAEVIEFRSALRQRPWGGGGAGAEAEGEVEAEVGAETELEVETESAVGPELDPELEAEPEAQAEPGRCKEDGVRLLARRARSSGELRAELLALEHDAIDVEEVVAEFESSHYLDDLGLARAVTEKLRDAKQASKAQIRRKLRERKLPDHCIEEALSELDVDEEFALLRAAAEQRAGKLRDLDRQTAERRLLGFLARRGWSGEPAMRAACEALDGVGRPSGGVRFR